MTSQSERAKPGEAIDLASVSDFVLGGLLVQPSLCRFSSGDEEGSVEPRVMQALVALTEANGAVVSRDILIDRCWSGRVVGDDAINRCIAKVRRLSETTEPAAFTIETISKVGYRLKTSKLPSTPVAATDPSPPFQRGAVPSSPVPGNDVPVRTPAPTPAKLGLQRLPFFIALVVCTGLLVVLLRAARPLERPAGQAPLAAASQPHSIAVLAFTNMTGDPSQDYLSDGLSEELIDVLSRVDQLQVTARTSSFYFKGESATIEQIASRLNVALVLEGSLRRQGSHLRIDARLNDARTGFQLWSKTFDRDEHDILKLQGEIGAAVTQALQVELPGGQAAALAEGGTSSPQAMDFYLHGIQHIRQFSEQSSVAALADFNASIKCDPAFAMAYSGRADALTLIGEIGSGTGLETERQIFVDARKAADRAVELAPHLGLTHAARAMVLSNGFLDMEGAWNEAITAQRLTPGNPTIGLIYAPIAVSVGHMSEAMQAVRHAIDLDPLRPDGWMELGFLLRLRRSYGEAFDAYQHVSSLDGGDVAVLKLERASAFIMQNDPGAARSVCANGSEWPLVECLAIADYKLGKYAEADENMAKLQAMMGNNGAYVYSEIFAQWGRPSESIAWLEKARQFNDSGLTMITYDPFLDPIRSQPKFLEVEKALHFLR